MRLHAGCVAVAGRGVLLRGPPGSGKSDLALRLIDSGARLVSDDQTELSAAAGRLFAAPPAQLAGLIEVHGAGIVQMSYKPLVEVMLVADLKDRDQIERMPEGRKVCLCGIAVWSVDLSALDPSAPAKIRAILQHKGEHSA